MFLIEGEPLNIGLSYISFKGVKLFPKFSV